MTHTNSQDKHVERQDMKTTMIDPPKKLLPMLILEILQKYTDADHRLKQHDIQEILKTEYDMVTDRKAIKRNIDTLIAMGYDIESTETVRMTPNPQTGEIEESSMMSGLWLEHEFTDSELRLIIDSLLFSQHIPPKQRKTLIKKLCGLSSRYFEAHVKHIHAVPDNLPQSPQLFLTIEVLDEAISKKRKIAFQYMEYGTDKKLHPRLREDGNVRIYTASPYQMAAKEGKYYLICNYDKYNDISNYRVDRIANIEILDEPIKPFDTLDEAKSAGLDLGKYLAEHVYMYSSPSATVKFRIVKAMVSDVIDEFGMGVEFLDEDDGFVTVRAHVNERAMQQFAKNFAPDVEILEPKRLT